MYLFNVKTRSELITKLSNNIQEQTSVHFLLLLFFNITFEIKKSDLSAC